MSQFVRAPHLAAELDNLIADRVRGFGRISGSVISFSEQVSSKVEAIAEPPSISFGAICWKKLSVRMPLPGFRQSVTYTCFFGGSSYLAIIRVGHPAVLTKDSDAKFLVVGTTVQALEKFAKLIQC